MADNLDENWQSLKDDDSSDAEDVDVRSQEDTESQVKTKDASRKAKKKQQSKKKFANKLSKRQHKPLQASDLITALTAHYHNKLSTVEMDEIILDEDCFGECNDLSHTANSYLKSILPHWKRVVKATSGKRGSPVLLIVCSSGIRAVELIREIADFKAGGCKVAKLFAKHFKLADQVKFLQKSVVHIAVGTPKRIHQILDLDAAPLNLDSVKYVVIDWSHSDVKQRRIVDIQETRTDMMELLRKYLIPHVKNVTEAKLVLY